MKVIRMLMYGLAAVTMTGCAAPKFPDYQSLMLPSKSGSEKQSVVLSSFSANPLVQNGEAYEHVRFRIPDTGKAIAVPVGTIVVPSDREDVVVYLEKSLGWMGHPDGPVSIMNDKKRMGAGIRVRGPILQLGLYGGSTSFEGGSSISAVVLVPQSVRVKTYEKRPFNDLTEYQSQGWFTLPAVPDAERTFLKYSKTR
ncbi:hypothetical protein [Roseimicrobium sp. ORNL1]|uniref:hypothetical protein n=1 Tax=Roseimicrobium sp. ORNL1 TaxID=2711231 RepID=UPI0013E1B728|nr:hypothetical protein [Roseimicrobium sp. ORNL1]QIF05260.1 hypothetical protein G5S37_28370 [Roseimicrobium sp. ORNL1]